VKRAFKDDRLAPLHLSSANSINIGRLLPQTVYYVASWLQVADRGGEVVFSVPSGNLGNITAGVIARRIGLPVARFIAASNVNDVLPEYLRTGLYRARPSIATLSNAMDVGDPSNFSRLVQLHAGSYDAVLRNVVGVVVTEDETRATIREVYGRTGYLLDPHSAVGYAAVDQVTRAERQGAIAPLPRAPRIVLSTAHPAKFGVVIEEALGFVPALPEVYRDWADRPLLVHDLPDTDYDTFCNWLTGFTS
jgi:threonine synthase